MPFLGKSGGRAEELRLSDVLAARDEYHPSGAVVAATFNETPRRSCSNPECVSGWTMPWRSRRRPIFEGQWGCSGRCVLAMVKAGLKREVAGRGVVQSGGVHRHRVPLGLVMLAQGWITHPQLQAALHAQKTSGSGRIGDWLVSECGLEEEQVTRGLSVQWSCPVLKVHGFLPGEMALVMPRQFVEEFGVVPLRVAGSRLLYLGWEDRLNASVAYAVEQMSGVKVESGMVNGADLRVARARLLEAEAVTTVVQTAEDEDALAAKITGVLEQRQPVAARLVRLHQYYWLRLWLESGTKGSVGNLPRSAEDMQDCIYTIGGRA
jgi:Type II secretion system (T2SS), protein E, N-terminal domain